MLCCNLFRLLVTEQHNKLYPRRFNNFKAEILGCCEKDKVFSFGDSYNLCCELWLSQSSLAWIPSWRSRCCWTGIWSCWEQCTIFRILLSNHWQQFMLQKAFGRQYGLLFYLLFAPSLNGPKWLRSKVPVAGLTSMVGVTIRYLESVILIIGSNRLQVGCNCTVSVLSGSVIGWFWIVWAIFIIPQVLVRKSINE